MEQGNQYTSLKGAFQSMVPKQTGVVDAIVISVSPLSVKLKNDDKVTISATSLIVPNTLTNHTVTVDIEGGTVIGKTENGDSLKSFTIKGGKMTISSGLSIGETVCLLSTDNNKTFVIVDRTGG